MSTKQSTVDYIEDCLSRVGGITSRKMFGEYALYCDGKVIALVCDDQLFMKPNPADAEFRSECEEAPAYPGSKNYLLVPEEKWEDSEWLCAFVRAAVDSLPAPKPKRKKG